MSDCASDKPGAVAHQVETTSHMEWNHTEMRFESNQTQNGTWTHRLGLEPIVLMKLRFFHVSEQKEFCDRQSDR